MQKYLLFIFAGSFSLLVLLPLIIGTLIYAVARPEGTILGVLFPRPHVRLPNWLMFNAPDGLWLFALLNIYRLIWGKDHVRENLLWIAGTTFFAISTEFLQRVHWIRGTFDPLDIVAYIVAGAIALLIFSNNYSKTIKQTTV